MYVFLYNRKATIYVLLNIALYCLFIPVLLYHEIHFVKELCNIL